jgi:kumamolisin
MSKPFMHGLLLAILLTIPLPISAITAQPSQFTPLYSHPTTSTDTTSVGSLNYDIEVTLLLTLRPQHEDILNSLVKNLSDPSSSNYRQYLTSSEFVKRFSPSDESYRDLVDFFESANLTVTTFDNRLMLTVKGTVNRFEQLLGVEFQLYKKSDNQTVYSAKGSPKLPSRFASLVYGVDGLSNATVMKTAHQLAPMGQNGLPPFTPQQIRSAYGATPLLNKGVDGSGQNITIVVAYGSPTLSSDLDIFTNQYSIERPHGTIYYPSGQPKTQNSGWATETTLDVTWASVIAPKATINLVVSPTPDQNLWSALNYAVSENLGKIISISWGDNEHSTDVMYEPILQQAVSQGISVFVSSGDCGSFAATSSGCSNTQHIVSYPASSPNAIAVGGTTLTLDSQNNYQSETAWNKSGGGVSTVFSRPWWQQGNGLPANSMRSLPDIAMVGDPRTGVPLYVNGQWIHSMGGTSLSAPLAAGSYALANNLVNSRLANSSSAPDLGFAAPLIYTFARSSEYSSILHDTASGSNGYYQSEKGWDPVTGWGSLNVDILSTDFANQLKQVSITALPNGVSSIPITVDGVAYSAPTTLWFVSGSAHMFTVKQTVQVGNGTRYILSSWTGLNNTSAPEQLIQITNNTSITLNYTTQYLLSVNGASSSQGGWFDAGATVQLQIPYTKDTVTETSRQNLISWQIDESPATPVQRTREGNITSKIMMNTYHTLTLTYASQYYLTINGGWNTTYSNSQTNDGWYDTGTTAQANSEYVWDTTAGQSRSNLVSLQQDGGTAVTIKRSGGGIFTTPAILMNKARTIRFNRVTQYHLTVSGGSDIKYSAPSPTEDDWFDKGTTTQILSSYIWNEKPNQSRQNLITYTLDGQTSGLVRAANGSAGPTVNFNNYHSLTFNSITQFPLIILGGSNTAFTGSKTGDNWFDDGTGAKAETDYTSNMTLEKERQNLISWKLNEDTTPNSVPRLSIGRFATPIIMMNKPQTVTFNTATQYPLKITGGGNAKFSNASPTHDEWFDSGQSTTVISDQIWNIVEGKSRTQLVAWQLDTGEKTSIQRSQSGQFTTPPITIDKGHTITFIYIAQYWLAIDPSGGTVDKTSQWLDNNSQVTITATSPSNTVTNRSRLLFTGWSDSDTTSNTTISITMNTFKSYTANWTPQNYVQVTTPIGKATGEGWYNSGSIATVKINPTTQGILIQQVFNGWTGGLTSTDPESKLVVNSSTIITAKWRTDYTQLILALASAGLAGAGVLLYLQKKKPTGAAKTNINTPS